MPENKDIAITELDISDYSNHPMPEDVWRVLYYRMDGMDNVVLSNPLLGGVPGNELTVICNDSNRAFSEKARMCTACCPLTGNACGLPGPISARRLA